MDTLGIQKALATLPAETQIIFGQLFDRLEKLEEKGAADVDAIADKVIGAVSPKIDSAVAAVNTLTITAGVCVEQATSIVRRIDGASMTTQFKLGPEIPDNPDPQMKVTA